MTVTRQEIPVRMWTFPGNTSDQVIIRKVKDDLRSWNLSRVIWVLDRGFTSERNRRYLQRAGSIRARFQTIRCCQHTCRRRLDALGTCVNARIRPMPAGLTCHDGAIMSDRLLITAALPQPPERGANAGVLVGHGDEGDSRLTRMTARAVLRHRRSVARTGSTVGGMPGAGSFLLFTVSFPSRRFDGGG